MENTDSNAWVFDSLVGFLHGPVWNVPLQTFIEEKSLPFEPTDDGEVQEKSEYKKIHDEYRNLVDVMLGSFMDDIGITVEQFEAACRLSAHNLAGLPAHFHRRLFQQIWAANDYDIFVKMMTHKNVELQLQALELIERRYGTVPNLFSKDPQEFDSSKSSDNEDWLDNDDVMTEIKKLQLDEPTENKEEIVSVPPEEVVAEKQTLLTKLQKFENKEDTPKKLDISIPDTNSTTLEPPKPAPRRLEVTEEDVRSRQQYLKQQRDKLLAMKKQVRERQLDAADIDEEGAGGEGSQGPRPAPAAPRALRPLSARAAAAALRGAAPPPPPSAMQLRKALASKLKTEVVDSNL